MEYCRSCATIVAADEKRGIAVEELARLYIEEQQSTTQLAALTGRSQGGVVALLKRHGDIAAAARVRGSARAVHLHTVASPGKRSLNFTTRASV